MHDEISMIQHRELCTAIIFEMDTNACISTVFNSKFCLNLEATNINQRGFNTNNWFGRYLVIGVCTLEIKDKFKIKCYKMTY